MIRTQIGTVVGLGLLAALVMQAQQQPGRVPPAPPTAPVPVAQDAQETQQQLSELFQHYPPALRRVLALDPSLLSNPAYLAPYPALSAFFNTHPDVLRDPAYYVGRPDGPERDITGTARVWEEMVTDVSVFAGFALAVSLIAWLIRTFIDSRRWNRLTKVQTDVHTKILDRLSSNDDLLAYMNSPAGSKFLESAPIVLDAGPRTVSAPLSRILWTVQGGVVLFAAGVGLEIVSRQLIYDAAVPIHALGILGMALGIGFILSAIISFMISRHLGLVNRLAEPPAQG